MADVIYIEVVFPLALPKLLTYKVPQILTDKISVGVRVEAEIGSKVYAGVIVNVLSYNSSAFQPKFILSVIDDNPIIPLWQLDLWKWISDYYCCTLGEVMEVALPTGLKMKSETKFISEINDEIDESDLSNDEYNLSLALKTNEELDLKEIQKILNKKSVLPIIKSLIQKNLLRVKEDIEYKYKEKTTKIIKLHLNVVDEISFDEKTQHLKSEKQSNAIVEIKEKIDLSIEKFIDRKEVKDITSEVLKALVKKEIIIIDERVVSRIKTNSSENVLPPLSEEQVAAISSIQKSFEEYKAVLIHGVTGSGKTRVYQELIQHCLNEGKQILYLLPEISLTSQIVGRLEDVFSDKVLVYNSRLNSLERVEIWNEALTNQRIFVAPRSGIFLPFTNLGLIIIDEEHDSSFKQEAPSPHYHARDVALFMASMLRCNIILGSATPSVESYYNTKSKKFDLVELNNRYGEAVLPKIEIIDLGYERKTGRYKDIITVPLSRRMKETLDKNKQVILFQNRRGYVPTLQCKSCGWTVMCDNCDVSLTLHKYTNELKCHYCNARKYIPYECPQCKSKDLSEIGLGTEKVEQKVADLFPSSKVGRFDFDTTRTKSSHEKLLSSFETGELQILVGTQMVTKGFDFDHVQLVGIINADALMNQPDFRANERAYQLMTQVAGRSGRRAEQGTVMIQTYMPKHPVVQEVIHHDYQRFFNRELFERKQFNFPPFVRLIMLEVKHKEIETTIKASNEIVKRLRAQLDKRISDPITPSISRINNLYIRQIFIKLERQAELVNNTKSLLKNIKAELATTEGFKSVKIKIDVDPY